MVLLFTVLLVGKVQTIVMIPTEIALYSMLRVSGTQLGALIGKINSFENNLL
jgi:hypothetical protein